MYMKSRDYTTYLFPLHICTKIVVIEKKTKLVYLKFRVFFFYGILFVDIYHYYPYYSGGCCGRNCGRNCGLSNGIDVILIIRVTI